MQVIDIDLAHGIQTERRAEAAQARLLRSTPRPQRRSLPRVWERVRELRVVSRPTLAHLEGIKSLNEVG